MKRILYLLTLSTGLLLSSCGMLDSNLLGGMNTSNTSSKGSSTGALSNSDIISGLKEALTIGANHASTNLNKTDGFFKNQAIKILLPKEAQGVERALRSAGMGRIVDDAILKINRAAEDAAIKAKPIFVSAIRQMTITDGLQILRGPQNAATKYLERTTSNELTKAFKPVIQSSVGKVGADRIWHTVFDTYNKLPLATNKVNPDLVGYVTEKALDGIFYTIAQEELKIRTNPGARVSDILKRVFGS